MTVLCDRSRLRGLLVASRAGAWPRPSRLPFGERAGRQRRDRQLDARLEALADGMTLDELAIAIRILRDRLSTF